MWKLTNKTGHMIPPRGHPVCGFDNEKCNLSREVISGVILLAIVITILGWFAFRLEFRLKSAYVFHKSALKFLIEILYSFYICLCGK
jgi:hypothetical protein